MRISDWSSDVCSSDLILGEDVRLPNRFYLGGDNFRGFRTGGIGPRDTSTGDSLGGEQYYKGSADLSFPIGLPNEYGIKGILFTEEIGKASCRERVCTYV